MVDYAIANQIRPFQAPDVAGIVGAMQGLELNRMRSQQLQGAEQERNALRQYLSDPNVDIMSPETSRRVLAIAPTIGGPALNAAVAARREGMQAQTAQAELLLKNIEIGRERLVPIRTLPEADRPAAYTAWLDDMERRIPGFRQGVPRTYSPEAYTDLISKANEIITNARPRYQVGPNNYPVQIMPDGTFRMVPEAPGAPPAAPPTAPRAEGPAMTPGQTAAAPRSQSTDPLLIDAAIRRNEGTARNPASSAVGPYQFIDSTFVDQFRRSFPDAAQNLSPEQILAFRGTQTPDGRRVEDVMGPALTAQNQQALVQAGFAPTAGNTYLAHFLGSGGARAVLRADPNTPISQLVSREAIDANPSILGVPGVTAGQIVQWANNTVDMGPRDARRALTAPNAMAAPGATTNAMLAPQDATAMGQPQLPTFAPPRSVAEALYQKNMMDLAVDLEKKRLEAERRRGEQPERVQEAGQTAGATARAQADVRREEQPARVEEAGQTVSAQTTARLEAEEAVKRRQDAERLDTAIREVRNLIRPGGLLQQSTGSGVGAGVDWALGQIGVSTRASQAAAQLAPIADMVLKMVPRFEGPQSENDRKSYEAAAGRLADSTRPNEDRLAAARVLIRIMEERRGQFTTNPIAPPGGAASATPTSSTAPTPPAPPAPPGMSQSDWGRLWGVMKPEERALWQN